ncbi:transporter substrate-binding domain-containing protein [Thermosipho sp. 1244]|uniref:transporter substrate-binding domain-containing protein n=1 Tax=Thermosipho sp. 1244 TaxID=1755816 RepID=UPI001BDE2B5B|nr:transporter substrate-binding domain-containing protein [Thermosipho sp. 1244]MBT1247122.1 hypothetical protein [Thermosipho sp. 1244]
MKRVIFVFLLFSVVLFSRTFMEILDSREILIATRNIPSETIYFPENEKYPGFCYELASGFAKYLGISPKIYVVEKFSEYFSPNFFEKTDMIADILTVTPERKKLMIMIPFVKNNEIFISREDIKATSLKDFKGKRVITYEDFAYYKTLLNLLEENNIDYVINKVIYEDNRLKFITHNPVDKDKVEILLVPKGYRYSPYFVIIQLLENNADISIFDSLSFVQKYFKAQFLRNEVKPLFSASRGFLAFGFKDKLLAREFKKYLESTDFNALFFKYFGIHYEDYLEMIGD